jgi:hypothetical protein
MFLGVEEQMSWLVFNFQADIFIVAVWYISLD